MNASESPRSLSGGWILLIVIVAVGAAGVLWWLRSVHSQRRVEVSIQEYLDLKEKGRIEEVWMNLNELTARINGGFSRGGRVYSRVHTLIPPAYVAHPDGFEKLWKGLDPLRVHVPP